MNHHFTTTVRLANALIASLIVLVPFHAFLTVWFASNFGNYTVVRMWSAVVIAALSAIVVYWTVKDASLRAYMRNSLLVKLIGVYLVVLVVFGLYGLIRGNVDLDAMLLGLWLHGRYLLLFVGALVTARYSSWLTGHWKQLVFVPAAVVVLFAVVQYLVLPADFLRHFGYSAATIEPYETINNNPEYIRVASTLRGANPLGAYLVVVISLATAVFLKYRSAAWREASLLAVSGAALLFSFSRSAWLGVIVTVAIVVALSIHSKRQKRIALGSTLVALVLAGVFVAALIDTPTVQNALFHTEDASKVAISSNDSRETALRRGVNEVATEPLGRGVGTAGPASVHNSSGETRLAENYYLQIGQEAGWLAVGLYVAIIVVVAKRLRDVRNVLGLGLLASLFGLVVVNLLSHAWTDDTLAFVWWGMAGGALGSYSLKRTTQRTDRQKTTRA